VLDMATVVLCGPANSAPDLLVGPFEIDEDAAGWIADQLAGPGRYMVAADLRSPQDVAG
jgi:hypothetical protein